MDDPTIDQKILRKVQNAYAKAGREVRSSEHIDRIVLWAVLGIFGLLTSAIAFTLFAMSCLGK